MCECGKSARILGELERVGSNGEVGRELGLRETEEALARAILGGPVVDAEGVGLGREVAVDLEGRERPGDGRGVDLAEVPPDPRIRVHAEVAHQRGEVDPGRVEPGVLEAGALCERIDDRVGEHERAAREGERRLRALDDVAADRDVAREVLREGVLPIVERRGPRPSRSRSGRIVSPAYRTSASMPTHPSVSGRATARSARPMGARACTWPSIAGKPPPMPAPLGKTTCRCPSESSTRRLSFRGKSQGGVVPGAASRSAEPMASRRRTRRESGVDAHAALDRAQRVVVDRDGPDRPGSAGGAPWRARSRSAVSNEEPSAGSSSAVTSRSSDCAETVIAVEVEVDRAVGDREGVEGGVEGARALLAGSPAA